MAWSERLARASKWGCCTTKLFCSVLPNILSANNVYCTLIHLVQAIKLIPEDVMLRAQTRADEEPLRLQNNWVAACCIFVMWDASAAGLSYLVCKKLGTPWWQVHWWIVAVTAVTVMILAEVAFVVHTLVAEQKTALQRGEQTSPESGVHAALLSTPDDGDQLQHDAHANV